MSYDHLVDAYKAIPKHVLDPDPVEHIDAVLERVLGEVALKRAHRERRESSFVDEVVFSAHAHILSPDAYRELIRETRLKAKKELLERVKGDLLAARPLDSYMLMLDFRDALNRYLEEIEEGLDP